MFFEDEVELGDLEGGELEIVLGFNQFLDSDSQQVSIPAGFFSDAVTPPVSGIVNPCRGARTETRRFAWTGCYAVCG
jgi:hypothetical protein